MGDDTVSAEHALQYAEDVTVEDVRAVGEFLLPRLEDAVRAHSPDSEEHRTASALAESVARLVLSVEWAITGGGPGRAQVSADFSAPALQTDEELRAQAETRLHRIRDGWNHLCAIAGYWRSSPAHNGIRWHDVRFLDAGDQRWYDQQVARLRAEGVLQPPRPSNLCSEGGPDNPSAR
jgi:hypothetical protein